MRRPEVWALLLASAGAVFWALKPPPAEPEWNHSEGETAAPAGRVTLLGATLERDYGNARLDLDVRVKNDSPYPLRLSPPKVRLLAGVREVPPFFLPAERPHEVAAGTASEVRLRYWLEAADLRGPLRLEVEGESVEVKSAAPFDLESVENRKSRKLGGVNW